MSAANCVHVLFADFNPNYKKEDRKRMRYIQGKYAQAYGDSSDDPNSVIAAIGTLFLSN